MKNNILVFDVESTSLYGTGFAVGAIVQTKDGLEIDRFELLSKEDSNKANDWVKQNVLPNLFLIGVCLVFIGYVFYVSCCVFGAKIF